jgi:RNA polymerase sigma-70 factor, ECF subfamily
MNGMDEERIIEETLKGNNQAFGELIMKHEPSVYRLALFCLRNGADAEEIAQEVFLASFRKLGQLRERRHFGAWLRAITLRHCAMWFQCAKKKDNDHQFDNDFSYT